MFWKHDAENGRRKCYGREPNFVRAERCIGLGIQELGERRRNLNGLRGDKFLELFEERRKERVEHRDRKVVLVKKVFMPMPAVCGVRELSVDSHDRRE